MNRIVVAYSGVHQAFQIALAAWEMGELDRFFCSIFDAPGKWGGALSRVLGPDATVNRRCEGIDPSRVTENPWPWLRHRLRAAVSRRAANDWFSVNEAFDSWTARRVRQSSAGIFVGSETCARYCFDAARERGMIRVLDAPQLYPTFVENLLTRAADDTGTEPPARLDPPAMAERKQSEFSSANLLLVYSEVHQRSFAEAGFKHFFQCPLWVDPKLWFPESACQRDQKPGKRPLKVLFVGAISLRKGIPYLLRAARLCGPGIKLSLIGTVAPELQKIVQEHSGLIELLPAQSKNSLRETYSKHDVLVLPSLADSFGFVALEAMACGLPVVVSQNCGVPVPDQTWRIPIMNAEAIAERLLLYAHDLALCRAHADDAIQFAAEFTPERYRNHLKALFDAA